MTQRPRHKIPPTVGSVYFVQGKQLGEQAHWGFACPFLLSFSLHRGACCQIDGNVLAGLVAIERVRTQYVEQHVSRHPLHKWQRVDAILVKGIGCPGKVGKGVDEGDACTDEIWLDNAIQSLRLWCDVPHDLVLSHTPTPAHFPDS